jgi:hypothetical protein
MERLLANDPAMTYRFARDLPMDKNQSSYRSYLLRVWQVTSQGEISWHATLEYPQTGAIKSFADLESLVAFLKEGQLVKGKSGGQAHEK